MTTYQKKSIATGAFNAQDLGGISVRSAIRSCENGTNYPDQSDHLTSYIVESINNATDIENIESDLNYAIKQLQRAKEGALYSKLI